MHTRAALMGLLRQIEEDKSRPYPVRSRARTMRIQWSSIYWMFYAGALGIILFYAAHLLRFIVAQ